MRTETLSREIQAGMHVEPPSDVQMLMHGAWLLAGVVIALAACTAADGSPTQPPSDPNVARLAPQPNASSGNVDDLTY